MDLDVNFEADDKRQPSFGLVEFQRSFEYFFVEPDVVSLEHDESASALRDLSTEFCAVRAGDNVLVEYVRPTLKVDLIPDGSQLDDHSRAHAILSRTDVDRIDS